MIRRTIMFGGKRHRIMNMTLLDRHGERYEINKLGGSKQVGLTPIGKRESYARGASLQNGFKLKPFQSPTLRTRQTAYHFYRGYKDAGGTVAQYKRAKKLGTRQSLHLIGAKSVIKDQALFEQIKKDPRGRDAFPQDWQSGKYSADKVVPASELARETIRRKI